MRSSRLFSSSFWFVASFVWSLQCGATGKVDDVAVLEEMWEVIVVEEKGGAAKATSLATTLQKIRKEMIEKIREDMRLANKVTEDMAVKATLASQANVATTSNVLDLLPGARLTAAEPASIQTVLLRDESNLDLECMFLDIMRAGKASTMYKLANKLCAHEIQEAPEAPAIQEAPKMKAQKAFKIREAQKAKAQAIELCRYAVGQADSAIMMRNIAWMMDEIGAQQEKEQAVEVYVNAAVLADQAGQAAQAVLAAQADQAAQAVLAAQAGQADQAAQAVLAAQAAQAGQAAQAAQDRRIHQMRDIARLICEVEIPTAKERAVRVLRYIADRVAPDDTNALCGIARDLRVLIGTQEADEQAAGLYFRVVNIAAQENDVCFMLSIASLMCEIKTTKAKELAVMALCMVMRAAKGDINKLRDIAQKMCEIGTLDAKEWAVEVYLVIASKVSDTFTRFEIVEEMCKVGTPKAKEVAVWLCLEAAAQAYNVHMMCDVAQKMCKIGTLDAKERAVEVYFKAVSLTNDVRIMCDIARWIREIGIPIANERAMEVCCEALDITDAADAYTMCDIAAEMCNIGTRAAKERAVEVYLKAAKTGNTSTRLEIANEMRKIPEGMDGAVEIFCKVAGRAIKKGNADMVCYVAQNLCKGIGTPEAKELAVRLYLRAATLTDNVSTMCYAAWEMCGIGTHDANKLAVEVYFKAAAMVKDVSALCKIVLGMCKTGAQETNELAVRGYLEVVAMTEDVCVMCDIACEVYRGEIPEAKEHAVRLCFHAASQANDVSTMCYVAQKMCEIGTHDVKKQAVELYFKAAVVVKDVSALCKIVLEVCKIGTKEAKRVVDIFMAADRTRNVYMIREIRREVAKVETPEAKELAEMLQ